MLKTILPDVEVVEAESGMDAALLCIQTSPDLVILDINMPDLTGIEACRQIRQRDSTVKVLMFSMYEETSMIREARDAGAMGYLSKSSPPERMLEAVKAVMAGESFWEASESKILDNPIDAIGRRPISDHRGSMSWLSGLPPRELEIAERLLDGKSNQTIADELGISAKTVANRATVIRQKAGVSSTAELIRKAIGS